LLLSCLGPKFFRNYQRFASIAAASAQS
jgi:hypothetical protein